ncbi:MAG TPA: tyrosine-type recombinase/integrase [Vicinamibacterales bacterium]|nr:tyrosine-type recombinase/integrase [Vicinamibacterales bacterium]
MTGVYTSRFGDDIAAFLRFKRALGYAYDRGEYMLRAFDRFASAASRDKRARLPDVLRAWLARPAEADRKAITGAQEYIVLRQFCLYRRRRDPHAFVPPREWAPRSLESKFIPRILSKTDVLRVLHGAASLGRPLFRAKLYRALLLILYCTGLRFGEACHLRIRDVDLDEGVIFVMMSKGRSRWVPFHASLAPELRRYLRARRAYARAQPDDRFFVGHGGLQLRTKTASETVRRLLCTAGLKPKSGRVGARPYDFRHAFAVSRLERWYRAGVDLQSRLPWLSAYMGHDNILGTEKYLHATPWLLDVAARRLRRRLARRTSP